MGPNSLSFVNRITGSRDANLANVLNEIGLLDTTGEKKSIVRVR
jgi:hypothetical protein